MTRNQLMASALSALMIATAVPAPALAEALDPSAGGAVADEQAVDGDEADDLGGAVVDEAAAETEAGTEAEAEAVGEAPAGTEVDEPAPAEKNEAPDGETAPAAVETADPEAQAAPAAQAAGDPYEAEAPAHDASAFVYTYGTVSYKYGENGSSSSTMIGAASNIASIGEPTKNEKGGWDVTVTLDAQATASDFGLSSWQVGSKNPKSVYIDAAASKLTIEFSTDSASDSSWSCSGPSRASIVFTDQASAQAPAFDVNDVLDVDNAVHYYANGSTKHATNIGSISNVVSWSQPVRHENANIPRLSYWSVDVTIKGAGTTAADYGVPTGYLGQTDPSEWVFDDSQENDLVTTFVLYDGQSKWQAGAGSYALLHFKHDVAPAAPTAVEVSNIAGMANYRLLNADGSEGYSVRSTAGQLPAELITVGNVYKADDGNYAVDVTVDAKETPAENGFVPSAGYTDAYKLVADQSTTKMTLEYQDGAWTYTWPNVIQLTFAPVVGPAFDINAHAYDINNVAYVVYGEDGQVEYRGSANLSALGGVSKVVKKGEPVQQEDDTWAVDVTLAEDTLTSLNQTDVPAYLLKHDKGDYVLDLESSDLTGTYRTTDSGTTYTITGTDRPTFVFRYQAPQEPQAPAFSYDGTVPVRYELRNADGTLITSGTTTRSDELVSVSDPYLDEEGNWAVDAWMPTLTPAGLGIDGSDLGVDDLDAAFALDEDASKTAVTLRTDGQDGTVYRCEGEDGPLYVYTAKSQLDLSGEQKPTDEKPGDDQGTKTDEKNEGTEKTDEKSESADKAAALPKTSDPISLQGAAAAALSGMSALLAALGVSSRRRRNG